LPSRAVGRQGANRAETDWVPPSRPARFRLQVWAHLPPARAWQAAGQVVPRALGSLGALPLWELELARRPARVVPRSSLLPQPSQGAAVSRCALRKAQQVSRQFVPVREPAGARLDRAQPKHIRLLARVRNFRPRQHSANPDSRQQEATHLAAHASLVPQFPARPWRSSEPRLPPGPA
jgi:hypothetical protein